MAGPGLPCAPREQSGRKGAQPFVRATPTPSQSWALGPGSPDSSVITASCLALRLGLVSGGGERLPLWPGLALEGGGPEVRATQAPGILGG